MGSPQDTDHHLIVSHIFGIPLAPTGLSSEALWTGPSEKNRKHFLCFPEYPHFSSTLINQAFMNICSVLPT